MAWSANRSRRLPNVVGCTAAGVPLAPEQEALRGLGCVLSSARV